jgi:ribosomal protein L11 methyltransferase
MRRFMSDSLLYVIECSCPPEDFELLSWQLFEAGAGAIEEIEDSEPLGPGLRIYSENEDQKCLYVQILKQYQPKVTHLKNEDWDQLWRDQQKIVAIGDSLRIVPPWMRDQADPAKSNLFIEAKMAFGTGSHESTRLVVELMDRLDMQQKKLLDIGTGTGILAMYALRLGAQKSFMTEIDPLTIPCIAENFVLNDCGTPPAVLGGLEVFKQDNYFDVILCNMIRTEFWPLRHEIERLAAPGASFVLSGQLESEKHYIMEWLRESEFELELTACENEWWAMSARKLK